MGAKQPRAVVERREVERLAFSSPRVLASLSAILELTRAFPRIPLFLCLVAKFDVVTGRGLMLRDVVNWWFVLWSNEM